MAKTFYEAGTPEEALRIYFQHDADLYGGVKNEIITRKLLSRIDSWKSLKVLEIGAGGGIWTNFFIRRRANVTCVDICEQILKGNAGLHREAKFILTDATTLRLNEKFDLIFVKDVIEHIKNDVKFLQNMNRHLKDRGLIVMTTQNSFSLNYVVEGFWNFVRGDRKWCGWDPTHLRFYNSKSLKKKLEIAGFVAERWFGCYYFPYKLITGLFWRVLGREYKELRLRVWHLIEILNLYDKWPFNIMGWSIGVVARKARNL